MEILTLSLNIGRITDKEVSKETDDLNNTATHLDLTDVYGSQYPKKVEYTFFSSAHGISPKQTIKVRP